MTQGLGFWVCFLYDLEFGAHVFGGVGAFLGSGICGVANCSV